MLINSTMGFSCNVYVIIYQIITLCTRNMILIKQKKEWTVIGSKRGCEVNCLIYDEQSQR